MTPKPDPNLDTAKAAQLFSLASHTTRIGILSQLMERDLSRQDLSDALQVKADTLQRHLSKLREQGLVKYDKEAGVYRIDDQDAYERLSQAVPEILPPPPPLPGSDED